MIAVDLRHAHPVGIEDDRWLIFERMAHDRTGMVKPRIDPPEHVKELVQLRRSANDPSELAPRLHAGVRK